MTLGDGRTLKGSAISTAKQNTLLPDGSMTKCTLNNVLLVPKLSYSLLSVPKATGTGKVTKFDNKGCEIVNCEERVIAFATRVRNLYHVEHCRQPQSVNCTNMDNKEKLWHRRFGHLGEQNLQKIAREKLVKPFNYDAGNSIGFCKT